MNRKLTLIAALLLGSASVFAAQSDEASRADRMDSAYSNYRAKVDANANLGPASRAEAAVVRGAERTGQAVKHGAQKTGEFVGNGARKTGNAIERGAKKTTEAVGNGMQRAGSAVERAGDKVEDSAKK